MCPFYQQQHPQAGLQVSDRDYRKAAGCCRFSEEEAHRFGCGCNPACPNSFPRSASLFAAPLCTAAGAAPRLLLAQYGTPSSCRFSLLSKWALSREARIALQTASPSSALAPGDDEQSARKILHRPLRAERFSRAASTTGTEKLLNVLPTTRQLARNYHSSYSTDGKNEAQRIA